MRPAEAIRALVCGLSYADRARSWLIMSSAFLDDSGSEPTDPVFVVAGLVAEPDAWEEFAEEWSRELKREPAIQYFKMSEAHSGKGQFKHGWTRPLINQKIDALTEIACKYARLRVGSMMRWADYNEYFKGLGDSLIDPVSPTFRDPYFLCFTGLCMKIAVYCDAHKIDPVRDYVLDEQSKVGDMAARIIKVLRESEEFRHLFPSIPKFEDDKQVLPLQAADLYAWHLHRWVASEGENEEAYQHIRKAFGRIPSIDFQWHEEFLDVSRASLWASAILNPQFIRSD